MHPTNPLLLLQTNKKMLRDQILLATLSSWELIKMSTQMQEDAASQLTFPILIITDAAELLPLTNHTIILVVTIIAQSVWVSSKPAHLTTRVKF